MEARKTVLNGPFALTVPDPWHSAGEERWLDIGLSATGRILVVWYVERGDSIRIIGCRRATNAEIRRYYDE
ncbi:MAG: BrnT family toxin [Candidatus Omnitrophica bacterium]|nr:BrnT family toxin [Candidatus Omnitrophota bacterium]